MTMNCSRWDDLYDDWCEGRLDAATTEACRLHAEHCPRCMELLELLGSARDDADAPDLVADVLERTTGSACERAHGLMAGRLDAEMADHEATLFEAHLEHCSECGELARILEWVGPTLQHLAVLEPDSGLVYDVLRGTSTVRARRRSGPMGRFWERSGAWWNEQIRRPLFAWEVAFTATVLAVLVFGTPLSPGREAPGRALATLEAAPVWVAERTSDVAGVARSVLVGIGENIDGIEVRTGPARHDLEQLAGRTGQALINTDFQELKTIGSDLDDAWGALFATPSEPEPAEETIDDNTTPLGSGS